jgi:hypothetical protein
MIKVVVTSQTGYNNERMFFKLSWYQKTLFFITSFVMFLIPTPSYSLRFFYEMGAGISQVRLATPFFDSLAPRFLSLGTALEFGMGVDFYDPSAHSNVHLGIQERYTSGSNATTSFSLHGPSLFFCFETNRLLFSLGAAPYLWKRISTTAGIDSFIRSQSSIGYLAELGYEAPITPEVSFIFLLSTQSIRTQSTWSPKPSLELIALLRFFLGQKTVLKKSRSFFGEGGVGEYDGYRYPYGWEINR